MKRNPGKYEAVVMFALGDAKVSEAKIVLARLATKVDDHAKRAEEAAIYLSEQYSRMARDIAEGRVSGSTPLSNSATVSLVECCAKFEAYKESLDEAFYLEIGRSIATVREEMRLAWGEVCPKHREMAKLSTDPKHYACGCEVAS
jgi:hypothetical protein